jgi:O-antigen/teichoic acid export membrane protein
MNIKLLPKSEFFRNVLTVMTGTGIAQAIPIAISPILTRIYTPEDFGVLALYVAVVSIVGVISTGRYELAVMLPKSDSDAGNLVLLSISVAVAVSFFSLLVVSLFNESITLFLGNPEISNWLYFVPFTILLTGIYQSLTCWNNRNKQYKRVSMSRVLQSSSSGVAQVTLGILLVKVGGLILGSIVGLMLGVLSLVKMSWSSLRAHRKSFCKNEMLKNAGRYRKFPMFSTWGALLDSMAVQVPILILSRFFGAASTGLFSMTFRIISMPMSLISRSIGQVLFQRLATLHNDSPELLRPFVLKTFLWLALMALPMVLVLTAYGQELFGWIFGADWIEAGRYASILSIAVAVRFAVSPLSSVLMLEHNIKKGVIWQGCYFVTIVVTLILASSLSIELFLRIFVAHEVVLYGSYLLVILHGSGHRTSSLLGGTD